MYHDIKNKLLKTKLDCKLVKLEKSQEHLKN